ncbi:MAG: acetylglutamate kinase, partial [Alphaproteobacteria bacterium]|nr:acetylglutamate kinase [Alphaproteobacteria bacterium]
RINTAVLNGLGGAEVIPVIAPIGIGADGQTYNINADTAAGAIAAALGASKLLMLTDVAGVLDGDGALISELRPAEARALIAAGTIAGGMIPKIETCLAALDGGVEAAQILDGRLAHVLILEIFTEAGVGTKIYEF